MVASACMYTVYYSTGSSIFNIRTVVLILVYILLPVISLNPGWLQPPFVNTSLSISHNSNYKIRDIRSYVYYINSYMLPTLLS